MGRIEDFELDRQRGFLPSEDPLTRLGEEFAPWETLAAQLPKLLMTDQLRQRIEQMDRPDPARLGSRAELERAMMLLSYLGHGYVWAYGEPPSRLPASLAVPWHAVGKRLGRPPVLSYASYALHNWQRLDPDRDIELGNIALLQNFLGGADEEWFILIHVDIEAKAGRALSVLLDAQESAAAADAERLTGYLGEIGSALERMYAVLARMPEHCDPYVYYNRVRPYIHGWKDNPSLPNGLVYEGVSEYGGAPQHLRGETGSQSSVVPSLDAFFGIEQKLDPLKQHLDDMRNYMPPRHRAFIEELERGFKVRDYVKDARDRHPELRARYNACIELIAQFRAKHLEYAANYIDHQHQSSLGNPTKIGTGGTPFMVYLKKHQQSAAEHLL